MKKFALLFAVGLLSLFSAEQSNAQKPAADPRPMHGLKPDTIRTYHSIQDFIRQSRGTGLANAATPIPISTHGRQTVQATLTDQQGKTASRASISQPGISISRAANGTLNWMTGPLGRAASFASPTLLSVLSHEQYAISTATGTVAAYRSVLGLNDPSTELRPTSVTVDERGATHVRLSQNYKGIPVWGRDLYVHTNASGDVYAINGTYEPTPTLVSTTPGITGEHAVATVIADLTRRGVWSPVPAATARTLGMSEPKASLVLYPHTDRKLYLAHEVTLHASLLESYTYLVDASSGAVLDRFARHCSILGHRHDRQKPVTTIGLEPAASVAALPSGAAGFQGATGTDLNGTERTMRTYRHTSNDYYAIWDLPNFNAGASQLPDNLSGGAVTLSADQNEISNGVVLRHVTSTDNHWHDASAVSAHSNMNTAYDYYRNTFGRKAIDGNDRRLLSVIHVTSGGEPMDNAFWNGELMAYGDGNTLCKPLAGSMDVAGHEMTHGVIEHTANLIYQGESGALNESFADVFGIMMDREDFLLGEDIMLAGNGPGIRDFENPDNPRLFNPQPAHMNQFEHLPNDVDNGGVHVNSGITNRACYLIIKAIGHEKTEKIYYHALTNYLTRNSQFIDCRRAVIQAAKDLYGDGPEMAAAATAFDTVGITDGQPGRKPNDVSTPEGTPYVTFLVEDGRIGIAAIERAGAGLFPAENGAVARISQTAEGVNYTLLSTPRDGAHIYFIDENGRLAFVDNATSQVWVFNNLAVQQKGDLWNASVSPDEKYVAFTSAYNDDRTIYIYDGNQIGRIELLPESTQSGVKDETVQYADVISWSPNMELPRLGFDAYRQIRLGDNTTLNFWSMFEIDLEHEKIYNLIPGQSLDISIGNMSYSKTDPDVIAFNTIAPDGSYDVMVADYEAGRLMPLNMSDYTFGGNPVTDAQRPSFSPDGSMIVVSSPENGALLVIDGEHGLLAGFQLNNNRPMYNPHWFALKQPSSVDNAPQSTMVTGAAPNPFRSSTRISFTLTAPAEVTVDVLNTRGDRVATLLEGHMDTGEHTVTLESQSLPAGVYTVRVRTGTTLTSERVVLVR